MHHNMYFLRKLLVNAMLLFLVGPLGKPAVEMDLHHLHLGFQVIFVDGAAHGQLFPRCSVIVHHGGAGTTYASAMSGVPCVIVPIFLDQYLHSNLVNKKGVGRKTMKQ